MQIILLVLAGVPCSYFDEHLHRLVAAKFSEVSITARFFFKTNGTQDVR